MKKPPITRRDKQGRWRKSGKFALAPRGKYFDGHRWRDARDQHRFTSPPKKFAKKPKKRKLPRRRKVTLDTALKRIKQILRRETGVDWRQARRRKGILDRSKNPIFRLIVDYFPYDTVDHWQVAAAIDAMSKDNTLRDKFRSARILPQIGYWDPEDRAREECTLAHAVSWQAALGQSYKQIKGMAQRYVSDRLKNGERPSSIEKVFFWIE